ncbi:MAG: hypothetical protein CVT72_14245 [Alphaproteobacteria bacterium HGW-Alphaproteobacteria-11]|nr:MAG: hypothetical protein CVT72_14245 [Alphaproteobacteria bacterium HGW-Alphaproteobacteria-11]
MRQKLFIHIGPHKTGTSSVQHMLYGRQKELKELGVVYPTANLGNWNAQHRLAFAIRGRRDKGLPEPLSRDHELSVVLDEIKRSGADTAILSSEEFSTANPKAIQFLRDGFGDFEVFVVLYARRQDETYLSTYTEKAKNPANRWSKAIHAHLESPLQINANLNIYRCVSRWAKVFGKDAIVVRLYDRSLNVAEDFLRCVDEHRQRGPVLISALKEATTELKRNESPSLEVTELMRIFKSQCDDEDQCRAVSELLRKHFANGRSAAELLSTIDRRAILERFRRSNEKLFREYFYSDNKFTPETLLQGPAVKRGKLTNAQMTKIIVDLLRMRGEAADNKPSDRLRHATKTIARQLSPIRRDK